MRYPTQRKYALLVLVVFSLTLYSCGTFIKPKVKTGMLQLEKGSYSIDQTHAAVLFKINHMGLSTFVGRFNKLDASLEFDPNHIANAKLSALIDIASIDVNNTDLENTLRSGSWLNAEKYPQAFFKTTSVKLLDLHSAIFSGNLTLHGVTAPIELSIHFNGGGNNMLTGSYTLGFSAKGSFKRSAYAIGNLIPAISDQVDIEVFAEFQKQ